MKDLVSIIKETPRNVQKKSVIENNMKGNKVLPSIENFASSSRPYTNFSSI
jgi:hypothetical protein